MNDAIIAKEIKEFSQQTHGSTDYHKDTYFIRGEEKEYAPLKYLSKKVEELKDLKQLLATDYVCDSFEFSGDENFATWYEHQFSRKLKRSQHKNIYLVYRPKNKEIFDAVESIHSGYEVLRGSHILLNGKNIPVQLGEWYAKCIFGLHQVKSASQRGFDFFLGDKRIEVKVHWADQSSPKGVKLRKSLVDLSDHTIIIYLARNFMIREICFLDSDFIIRKYSTKGHTIFLKDSDISDYFFSKSNKHLDKVVNSNALLKFSNPNFAMKIAEDFSQK